MEEISAAEVYKIRTVYLHNFYNHVEVSPLQEVIQQGDGINISYEHLTEELVQACHSHGKLVCVWIDTDVTKESQETYRRLIDL